MVQDPFGECCCADQSLFWVMNMKKTILSYIQVFLFQLTVKNFDVALIIVLERDDIFTVMFAC